MLDAMLVSGVNTTASMFSPCVEAYSLFSSSDILFRMSVALTALTVELIHGEEIYSRSKLADSWWRSFIILSWSCVMIETERSCNSMLSEFDHLLDPFNPCFFFARLPR